VSAQNGHHGPGHTNGVARSAAGNATNGNGVKHNGSAHSSPRTNGTRIEPDATSHVRASAAIGACIDSVELQHIGASRRCRVVVAAAERHFIGVAETIDNHLSDMDLVGRASIDALRAARSIPDALKFEGATVTDVAGRPHVIVSIARGNGRDFDFIAGAEPIRANAAEAAARAVIGSLNAWQP
jgi:hypothetical protein